MKLFEGKSPEERNKTIAAIVLGVLAIGALTYGIILPTFFSGKKTRPTTETNGSPSPTETLTVVKPDQNLQPVAPLPNQQDMDFAYTTQPVLYSSGGFSAPSPGRNIFAFYEPPKPTPFSPTPTPTPTPFSPTPTPTPPPIFVAYATPQSVYAGTDSFRLEVNGDKFTEDAVILFNGSQLPTRFVTAQGLVAQVPKNFIASAGQKQISVITPDGKFSNMVMLNVQAPPKPQFQYIGMISRKRNNNDEAYFQEKGNEKKPIVARLNDIVAGRFRLKSISADEVVFEDVNLGFRHTLDLYRPEPGSNTGRRNNRRGNFTPYNRNRGRNSGRRNTRVQPARRTTTTTTNPTTNAQPQKIPGIPNNIPRYQPTPRPTPKPNSRDNKKVDN